MARISQLRTMIRNDFLKNDVISGAEAKRLVDTVAKDGLGARGKQQLEKLRNEFQSKFSTAGLRDFDAAVAKALQNRTSDGAAGGGNALSFQGGADLSHIPTSFKLREVRDPDVKRLLRRMDLNIDGSVDSKDQKKLGLNDQQWQMFIYAALLGGKKIDEGDIFPQDLSGKKVCFTAVPDKAAAVAMATAMGATVVSDIEADLDFLVVGSENITGKDERAHAFNVLGKTDIGVGRWAKFLKAAEAAGAVPQPDDAVDATTYDAIIEKTMRDWYNDMVESAYEDEFTDATPAERQKLLADKQEDLDNFGDFVSDDYAGENIDEMYEWQGPYMDANGLPIPRDSLDVVALSMYPNFAGIGLSKTFVFDKRNGNLVDDFDMQD
jgi:hypothetical protein